MTAWSHCTELPEVPCSESLDIAVPRIGICTNRCFIGSLRVRERVCVRERVREIESVRERE